MALILTRSQFILSRKPMDYQMLLLYYLRITSALTISLSFYYNEITYSIPIGKHICCISLPQTILNLDKLLNKLHFHRNPHMEQRINTLETAKSSLSTIIIT